MHNGCMNVDASKPLEPRMDSSAALLEHTGPDAEFVALDALELEMPALQARAGNLFARQRLDRTPRRHPGRHPRGVPRAR